MCTDQRRVREKWPRTRRLPEAPNPREDVELQKAGDAERRETLEN